MSHCSFFVFFKNVTLFFTSSDQVITNPALDRLERLLLRDSLPLDVRRFHETKFEISHEFHHFTERTHIEQSGAHSAHATSYQSSGRPVSLLVALRSADHDHRLFGRA